MSDTSNQQAKNTLLCVIDCVIT